MKVTVTILPGIVVPRKKKNRKAVRPCAFCIVEANESWAALKELSLTFGKRQPTPKPNNTRFRVEDTGKDACNKHIGKAIMELWHAAQTEPK